MKLVSNLTDISCIFLCSLLKILELIQIMLLHFGTGLVAGIVVGYLIASYQISFIPALLTVLLNFEFLL